MPGPPPPPRPRIDFEAIYRENFAFVWRSLRHQGVVEAQLEDAAHEVFIVLFRKFDDYAGEARITTLLYGIARRVAANQRRSHARHDRRRQVAPTPDGHHSPEEHMRRQQGLDLVERFMAELPEQAAETFRLSQVEGKSAREIAEMLGLNINTVQTRIRAVKTRFAKFVAHLEQPGLSSSPNLTRSVKAHV